MTKRTRTPPAAADPRQVEDALASLEATLAGSRFYFDDRITHYLANLSVCIQRLIESYLAQRTAELEEHRGNVLSGKHSRTAFVVGLGLPKQRWLGAAPRVSWRSSTPATTTARGRASATAATSAGWS